MNILKKSINNRLEMKQIGRYLLFAFVFFSPFLWGKAPDFIYSIDSITYKVEKYGLSDNLKARALMDSLYRHAAQSPDSLLLQAHCLYWEASIATDQGAYDSSMVPRINKMKNLLDKQQVPFEKALLQLALSLTYMNKGDYARSFTTALESLEQFKELKNNSFISKSLYLIGNICGYTQSYDMAEEYYNQALTFTDTPQRKYRIRLNIYSIWCLSGRAEAAIDSLSADMLLFTQEKDTALLVVGYTNLGACYAMHDDQQQAESCYQSAFTLIPAINNLSLTFGLYLNTGVYYLDAHKWEEALHYFKEAKKISINCDNMEQLSFSYFGLSKAYEQIGQTDSALFYLNQYHDLNDNQINKTKAREVYRAYIEKSLVSTQKELTIAQQKIALKSKQFVIIIGFSISVILLIALGLIVIQQKAHIKDAKNKKLEEELRNKQRIEKLQEDHIETQKREITSYTLMLSNKNHILQQIGDVIKRLPKGQAEAQDINQIIKSNMNTDNAWETFMLHFEKVHPDFFNKLKALNNDMTNNDLQFCAYIRIGMSSKQIAQILNISYGSTRNHRSRIKKKLGLQEEEHLDELIMKL